MQITTFKVKDNMTEDGSLVTQQNMAGIVLASNQ